MFGCMFQAFPQQQKIYYDTQIRKHISAFRSKSEIAIKSGNKNRSEVLFDSLFENHLKFSYVRNMSLKKVNGGTLKTASLKKPFLLITKSSWEIIKDEEIEEVNRMSKMYRGQIKIIVLFWNSKKKAKTRSKGYNSNVIVTYVNERDNDANHIIKPFKHAFGAPACFFVSEEKQLLKIDRKFTISNSLESTEIAFSGIHEKIKWLLFEEDNTEESKVLTKLH